MSQIIDFTDMVCIITGAGKGIGFESAKLFASLGAKVAVISRTEEDLLHLKEVVGLPEESFLYATGDASDSDTVKKFVNQVYNKFGVIDVLFNNAGMRFRKSFLDISVDEWDTVMKVNVGSCFLFCQEVGRVMVAQGHGKIINMASIIGTLGLPELAGYGASKGAIISLTKSLATEWAEHNINVNAVVPGFCETSYAENFKKKTDLYQFTLDRTPMKRWGGSNDVANACAFLASSMSDYITGEILNVDGGWSAW